MSDPIITAVVIPVNDITPIDDPNINEGDCDREVSLRMRSAASPGNKALDEWVKVSDLPSDGIDATPTIAETNREVHETGAVRSKDTNGFDFDLLSPVALMCAAGVMSEGAHKYNRGNYLKGFKQSTLYQHLMMHLCMFLLGDTSEDHRGHAQWNLNAMIHFMATRPDLDDRVKYDLTPEQLAAIKERFRFTPPTPKKDAT